MESFDRANRLGFGLLRVLVAVVLIGLCACASRRVPAPAPPLSSGPADGALRVQLGWAAPADLDLYVTDPAFETVYFANTPARSGGRLERDARCSTIDPARPAVELTVWDNPPAGQYRVGVDYIERCGGKEEPVAYRVAIDLGGQRAEVTGTVERERFQPIVMEFVVRAAPEGGSPSLEVRQ